MIGQRAGYIAVGGTISFVLILALLHVLRHDLDPSWRAISEYAVGRHGWLMTLAFLLLGAVSGALAAASWTEGTRRLGRFGAILLAITAMGMTLAGIFETDPITGTHEDRTTTGMLHEWGALLDLTPFAAIVVSVGFLRGAPSALAARRALTATMVLPLIGLAVFAAATASQMPPTGVGSPDVLIGWPNRLLILSYCAWYAAAGWYLLSIRARR